MTPITNEQLKTRPFFDEFIEGDLINADPAIGPRVANVVTPSSIRPEKMDQCSASTSSVAAASARK